MIPLELYIDNEDINRQFDRHPNPHSLEKHVYRPPEAPADTAVESHGSVEEPVSWHVPP